MALIHKNTLKNNHKSFIINKLRIKKCDEIRNFGDEIFVQSKLYI